MRECETLETSPLLFCTLSCDEVDVSSPPHSPAILHHRSTAVGPLKGQGSKTEPKPNISLPKSSIASALL